jgi:hypothetical protein
VDPAWIAAGAALVGLVLTAVGLYLQFYLRRPHVRLTFPGSWGTGEQHISFGVRAVNNGGGTAIDVKIVGYVDGTPLASVRGIHTMSPQDWWDTNLEVPRPSLVDLADGTSEPKLKGRLRAVATWEGSRRAARATYKASAA